MSGTPLVLQMETEEPVDRVSCRLEQDPRTGLHARLGGGAGEEGTRSPEARKAQTEAQG